MEGNRRRGRPRQKLMDWVMEDGYWKLREKGTTSRRVKSSDIWTCREAGHLKKKNSPCHLVLSVPGTLVTIIKGRATGPFRRTSGGEAESPAAGRGQRYRYIKPEYLYLLPLCQAFSIVSFLLSHLLVPPASFQLLRVSHPSSPWLPSPPPSLSACPLL